MPLHEEIYSFGKLRPPPMAGHKKIKVDISDFEVSCGLSSPKSPDISTSLRLSAFEHHLLLLPVADFDDITVTDRT